MSTWLITGCSTGLGACPGGGGDRGWSQRGRHRSRDVGRVADLQTSTTQTASSALPLDVTDTAEVIGAVRKAEERVRRH